MPRSPCSTAARRRGARRSAAPEGAWACSRCASWPATPTSRSATCSRPRASMASIRLASRSRASPRSTARSTPASPASSCSRRRRQTASVTSSSSSRRACGCRRGRKQRRPRPRRRAGRPERKGRANDHAASQRPAADAGQPALHLVDARLRVPSQHRPARPDGGDARFPRPRPRLLVRPPVAADRRRRRLLLRPADGRPQRRRPRPARARLHAAQLLRGDDPPAAALVHGAVAGGADPAALSRRAGGLARRPPDRRRHVPGLGADPGARVPGTFVACCHLGAARAAAKGARPGRKSSAVTELRNTEREISRFRFRLLAAALFVLVAFGLLVARLAFLQISKHEDLSTQAENNRIAVVPITPNRGLILDRNGVVLANNYSAYTLEIQPGKVSQLDKTIDALAEVVEIQPRDRKRFKRLLDESKSVESLPIRTRLSDEEVARFTAQKFRFDGVEIKARLFRSYPLGEVGSHLIGYIGRINPNEKKQMEEDWSEEDLANYRGTEYIGKLGIEQSYESELHGTTGFEEVEMSAGGHAVRRLKSNPATPGNAVVLSIDIKLQAMVEQLFGDRRGALVAIDPRNGEILAFVSKPNFD